MPIAWLQLVHKKFRFIATLFALGLIVNILFMQLGFQDALFDSAVGVHQSLEGDLFMISTQYQALTSSQIFPKTRLYQTLAFKEVESVKPLYGNFGKLKNIETGEKFSIYIFGIDPQKPAFKLEEINQNLDILKMSDNVLFDRSSRPEFGPIAQYFQNKIPVSVEISPFNNIFYAKRYNVRGLFTIGPSFGLDGILVTSYATFLNTFLDRSIKYIDIGIIKTKPKTDIKKLQHQLRKYIHDGVRILTLQEFIFLEKDYWNRRTPIGFVFNLMVTMAFIMGIGISYQILYSSIANNLIEYATLKAIGFTDNYLLTIVVQQALILAILGYIPGLIVSYGLFDISRQATHLPIQMTMDKILIVLASVITMCCISAIIAMQKIRDADPADIF